MRDYGTGLWAGGDEDCDHDARQRRRNEASQPGTGNAGRVLRDGVPPATCSCGATRQDQQLGLEATPDLYVARMIEVFREVRRVLRADGTCWVNLGDTYNSRLDGSHGGWNGSSEEPQRTKNDGAKVPISAPGMKPKDLVGIPWRVAFALQADGWYLRSDIIWAKPNPMPESVTDRPTKAHEYVFLLSKEARYFFDQEAVREPHGPGWVERAKYPQRNTAALEANNYGDGFQVFENGQTVNPAGRNVRSVWDIATQPYPEAHFATYPEELVRRCVLAGTSERGCCPVCGKPWERETASGPDPSRPQAKRALEIAEQHGLTDDHLDALRACGISDVGKALVTTNGTGKNDPAVQALADEARAILRGYSREFLIRGKTETLGWRPCCRCEESGGVQSGSQPVAPATPPVPIPCTVLDPFLGSGTTAYVARKHGRRSIGIELNPAYADLAARRMQQQSLLV